MKEHRGTIHLEQGRILAHEDRGATQHLLRIAAPRTAARAVPGSFVHLTCDTALPMRRPISIMRASAAEGWIELLYKVVGTGTAALAARRGGEAVSVLGPIGNGFTPRAQRPHAVLIGGGVGIPPLVFLAERLHAGGGGARRSIAFFGSELAFPFKIRPSTLLVPGMPPQAIACLPMLEDWGVPCRLASFAPFPGCFEGYVTELAAQYLATLSPAALREVEIFACGPTVMLAAVAKLARRFELPAQVSLEEYMACAVGGCAGCAVAVQTPQGRAMKRVCVDGPVFEASSVFGAAAG